MSAAAAASPHAAASAPSSGAAAASAAAPFPAAAAPAPGSPAPAGKAKGTAGKGAKPDVKALPIEEAKPPVFKNTRAKKLFKLFDGDRDKFLNRAEFAAGLVGFVNAPELAAQLDAAQIDALFAETDVNKDDKISWHEFAHRFCGGPHPSTLGKKVEKKASLMLQTPRKKEPPAGKMGQAMAELRAIMEALYDGSKPRYPGVDLSGARALLPPAFKKLLNQTLAEEKAEAKEKKRPLEPWAAKAIASGCAADGKLTDRLFAQLDERKSGKVDLGPFFEQLKLRPSSKPAKGKSTKKGSKDSSKLGAGGPQAYVLTTVKAEHVRDFVSEVLLRHFPKNVNHSVKMHPPLKHWGDDERKKKGLNADSGYKTTIFLSERTKVKAIVKLAPPPPAEGDEAVAAAAAAAASKPGSKPGSAKKTTPMSPKSPSATSRSGARSASTKKGAAASASAAAASPPPPPPTDVLIFASFRTEYTSMARCESLWHARIRMDSDEVVRAVECREKKNWVDGELDKLSHEPVFEEWITYVGHEDEFEEMSIPPIG